MASIKALEGLVAEVVGLQAPRSTRYTILVATVLVSLYAGIQLGLDDMAKLPDVPSRFRDRAALAADARELLANSPPVVQQPPPQAAVAVCITGVLRTLFSLPVTTTYDRHVVQPLRRTGYAVDAYLSIVILDGNTSHEVVMSDINRFYKPAGCHLLDTEPLYPRCHANEVLYGRHNTVHAVLLQFYATRDCYQQVEAGESKSGTKYAWIYRLRSDTVYFNDLLPVGLSPDFVYMPANGMTFHGKASGVCNGGFVNDHLFLCPRQLCRPYFYLLEMWESEHCSDAGAQRRKPAVPDGLTGPPREPFSIPAIPAGDYSAQWYIFLRYGGTGVCASNEASCCGRSREVHWPYSIARDTKIECQYRLMKMQRGERTDVRDRNRAYYAQCKRFDESWQRCQAQSEACVPPPPMAPQGPVVDVPNAAGGSATTAAAPAKKEAFVTLCGGWVDNKRKKVRGRRLFLEMFVQMEEMCSTSICSLLSLMSPSDQAKYDVVALVDNFTPQGVLDTYAKHGVKVQHVHLNLPRRYTDEGFGRIQVRNERYHCQNTTLVKEKLAKGFQHIIAKPYGFYKLEAWNLTQYSKVFLFDPDIWFVRNPKIFFERYHNESFVAAMSQYNCVNTGTMLLVPDEKVYKGMYKMWNDGEYSYLQNEDDQVLITDAALRRREGGDTLLPPMRTMGPCDNDKHGRYRGPPVPVPGGQRAYICGRDTRILYHKAPKTDYMAERLRLLNQAAQNGTCRNGPVYQPPKEGM